MIQTMQFTYGHLVSINSTKKIILYYFYNKICIFQNVHSKFYKEKQIAIDIIHYCNNDFILPTIHNFFVIEKSTTFITDE
jgi:hypothetical protein